MRLAKVQLSNQMCTYQLALFVLQQAWLVVGYNAICAAFIVLIIFIHTPSIESKYLKGDQEVLYSNTLGCPASSHNLAM